MYRLIVSDLDETLLNSSKNVSQKDIDSINSLQGVRFVVSTGRGYDSISGTLKQIGQYNKQDTYSITFNGGLIIENKNNRILYEKGLDFDDVKKVFELGKKYDVCMHVYIKGVSYTYRLYDNERKYITGVLDYVEIDDIDFLKDVTIMKILYGNEDFKYLENIRREINLENEFEICYSANRYLEFNPKGINKGSGLMKLADILGIDITECIAIGDSSNDLSMIKTAGLGVAVSNAVDLIKQNADIVLESDHNNSPISEVIKRFI